MMRLAGYFAALEITSFLGFIVLSSHQSTASWRLLPFLIAVIVIVYIAFSKARRLSINEINYVSIISPVIFITVDQILGFTLYPGLVKDIEFFSRENAITVGIILFAGVLAHFLLLRSLKKLSQMIKTNA
jgi:MFS family permease